MNPLGTVVLAGLTATLISMVATKPSRDDYIQHVTTVIPPKVCVDLALRTNPSITRQDAIQFCENTEDMSKFFLDLLPPSLRRLFDRGFQNLVDNNSDCGDYLVLQICFTDLSGYEHKSLAVFGRLIDLDP